MYRRIILPVIIGVLAYGFWLSPDFKTLAAGVAVFLFGMLSLEQGFKAFTGGVLERLLSASTRTTFRSIGFGIVSTTLMQSSSLVSIITISFLSAGLLGLGAGIGVVFGANLGTTTGAWLVAGLGLKVNIAAYAMPLLVFGVLLIFQKARALRGIGYVLAGLGFLFLGIHYIKEGFDAFGKTIDLAGFRVDGIVGILLFTLIGTVATVVMQSSHATMVLIITAVAAGQITYESSLALAIGANVGTTITAIIGALGANAQGRRLAAAHLVFNVITAVGALLLLAPLVWIVDEISVVAGIAADDYALKLAVFHTVFNLAGLVLMTPLIPRLVSSLEQRFVEPGEKGFEPLYLNSAAIDFPETAVEAVRNEVRVMYDNAVDIILAGLGISKRLTFSEESLDALQEKKQRLPYYDMELAYTQRIKGIYSAIIAFISKTSFTWELKQSGQLHWLRTATQDLAEAVKHAKHMQKNVLVYAVSENQAIRAAYNDVRIELADLIRHIYSMRENGTPEVALLGFDDLKLRIDKFNTDINRKIATMLQQKSISNEMATSLMNDSSYASNIAENLISAAHVFLASNETTSRSIQDELALTPEEIDEITGAQDELETHQ